MHTNDAKKMVVSISLVRKSTARWLAIAVIRIMRIALAMG